jgi:methylation protein EvaC
MPDPHQSTQTINGLLMTNCRICAAPIAPFMSFGQMPIANGFLLPEQFEDEYFFELAPAFCNACSMVQIIEQPDPEVMFHENYAFFSRTSRYMQEHFARFAEQVRQAFMSESADPFVVELGSNDGIMLQNFADKDIRHLGVEPSSNVAEIARGHGVNTICEFFDEALAERLIAGHGHADAVLSANVMCHIPDLNSVAAGIARLLKPTGVLVFEDPYLGDVIEKTSYDQIYDEHVFVFSATSVSDAFARHGLELINVEPQITHGGSMRYTLAPKGSRPVASAVGDCLAHEGSLGLGMAATYERFRENCEASRDGLLVLLNQLRDQGARVVGYGATSKSTTVMNYCGIGPEHIEFISDTTPTKQGKFTPGSHIAVKSYDAFIADYPSHALLFAWNHKAEIMAKEDGFRDAGGKWIEFIPKVQIS